MHSGPRQRTGKRGDSEAETRLDSPAPAARDIRLDVGGIERSCLLLVPDGGNLGRPKPLVIALHGAGGTARTMMQETRWHEKAERDGFLVAFPEAMRRYPGREQRFATNPQVWNDGSGIGFPARRHVDDVGFVAAVIDAVCAEYAVDDRRVFVAGFSSGGSLALRAGANLSRRIAAVGVVAGQLWQRPVSLTRPVSLLYIVGAEDPVLPLEGGEVRLWGTTIAMPPPLESVADWARALGCPARPRTRRRKKQGIRVIRYGPCRAGSVATAYVVEGMGHTWPGGNGLLPTALLGPRSDALNATDALWEFFSTRPIR